MPDAIPRKGLRVPPAFLGMPKDTPGIDALRALVRPGGHQRPARRVVHRRQSGHLPPHPRVPDGSAFRRRRRRGASSTARANHRVAHPHALLGSAERAGRARRPGGVRHLQGLFRRGPGAFHRRPAGAPPVAGQTCSTRPATRVKDIAYPTTRRTWRIRCGHGSARGRTSLSRRARYPTCCHRCAPGANRVPAPGHEQCRCRAGRAGGVVRTRSRPAA